MRTAALVIGLAALLPGCSGGAGVPAKKQADAKYGFPAADRPVATIVSARWSNEESRDRLNEADTVMNRAGIKKGMNVADIGAGEGYYTIRLATRVGAAGRVLAEDIVPEVRDALATRVSRERLDNVSVRLGLPADPRLPEASFDRILMIHMYHEIQRPSEFLWHLRDGLSRDGRVIVVDADRPTGKHGTPPRLLICEFGAIGYELTRFERLADPETYFAQFEPRAPKPAPEQIRVCPNGS
jgi:SAM-dependent methyltransferase